MTRGNQRDLARAKNAKKLADHGKGKKDDGLSPAARKQRDAEIMQQKQKKGGPEPSGSQAAASQADEKAK